MTIYESELSLVKKRLENIKNEKNRPGSKVFVIAAGDPVLEEYKDEYIALKRMEEILETNFQQKEDYEYLNARKATQLSKLTADAEERLVHSTPIIEDSESTPEATPEPETVQEEIPVAPKQQQDNLIYLTPEQLEKLVTDAVSKALAQLNPKGRDEAPKTQEPGETQAPEQPPIEPPIPDEPLEQAPDLSEEELAGLSQRIIHGGPDEIEDDDDLEPIVKVTKWQWIKNHKKPILIALGITALALTVALGLPNIFPNLNIMNNSQEVANLAGQMVENSKQVALNAADQLSLHSANTALAEEITSISKIQHAFDSATGTWTFGTKGLQDFIASQTAKASQAAATLAGIRTKMIAGGAAGLGLVGTGLILPRTKSQEFKDVAKEIKEYSNDIEFTRNSELEAKYDALENKIKESTTLKEWEQKKLLKKLKKAQMKVDFEIQYRDDPDFEEGQALGETLSEPESRKI